MFAVCWSYIICYFGRLRVNKISFIVYFLVEKSSTFLPHVFSKSMKNEMKCNIVAIGCSKFNFSPFCSSFMNNSATPG